MPSLTRCGYSDNQKYEKDALVTPRFFSRIIFIFLESTQFYSRIIEGGGGFRSGKSQAKFPRWFFWDGIFTAISQTKTLFLFFHYIQGDVPTGMIPLQERT